MPYEKFIFSLWWPPRGHHFYHGPQFTFNFGKDFMIYIVCSCKFVFKLSSPNTWANIMANQILTKKFTMQNQIKMNRWTYCLWHNMNIKNFNALGNIINDFLSKSQCTLYIFKVWTSCESCNWTLKNMVGPNMQA
jgi:hypothetical protein